MEIAPWGTRRGMLAREVTRKLRRQTPIRATLSGAFWYLARRKDVFFVQIGSHNAATGDPVTQQIDVHGWRGIMVEPVPGHFDYLRATRGSDPRIRLVEAAITDHDGTAELTVVEPTAEMPDWADQLASLDPGVVLTHEALIPDLREHIHTITVTTMTFATLTAELERIDLLHVDTEGHDAAILAQVDFERWTPAVIVYEHKHLSAEDADVCRARLESAGYSVYPLSAEDTFATKGLSPFRWSR